MKSWADNACTRLFGAEENYDTMSGVLFDYARNVDQLSQRTAQQDYILEVRAEKNLECGPDGKDCPVDILPAPSLKVHVSEAPRHACNRDFFPKGF